MTEKKTNVITVNDIEYNVDEMTETQQLLLAHIQDLDRKIASTQFNLHQLLVGKDAFAGRLAANLETPVSEAA